MALGKLLGFLGAILAALGAVLDRSWELLGPLGAILGALGSEPVVLRGSGTPPGREDTTPRGGNTSHFGPWGEPIGGGKQQPETSY